MNSGMVDRGVPMHFGSLPAGTAVPTVEDIARAVVSGFPPDARERATMLLVYVVLPWDLRGIDAFPTPRRLVDTAFAALVGDLARVEAAGRLERLEEIAWRRRGQRMLERAVGLAVARYSRERPRATLPEPWREAASSYRDLDLDQLLDEAAEQLEEITSIERTYDAIGRRALRASLPHARVALHAASTGSFAAASGSLLVFLNDVGESSHDMTLDITRPRTGRIPRQLLQVPTKSGSS